MGADRLQINTKAMFHDVEDREMVLAEMVGRLSKGETLAQVCRSPHMPNALTVATWCAAEPDVAELIARARQHGFDAIAQEAVDIVDGLKPVQGVPVDPGRDKARADVRLRLLSKWDPRRYGDAVQLRHADADGEKLDVAPMVAEVMTLLRGPGSAPEGN